MTHSILEQRTAIITITVLVLAACGALAANQPSTPTLTPQGEALALQYQKTMDQLRQELADALPVLDRQKEAAYGEAHKAEMLARIEFAEAEGKLGGIKKAEANVAHAKDKLIAGADKGIARAQEMLKTAKTDDDREAAQAELTKWQENRTAGLEALKEREAALDEARINGSQLLQDVEVAGKTLATLQANVKLKVNDLDLPKLLDRDELDTKLAKHALLLEATPAGLAAFAQQDEEHEALVSQLLDNEELILRMLSAGGAMDGKYGEAMNIYTDIQKISKGATKPGILQNLALGICLEMVVPYRQGYGTFMSRGRKPMDPVERYQYYEKAYLEGELDPAFKDMTAWECRWIASDPSSNEELTWLRTMIRNYRPDLIAYPDPRWYYTRIIKTDVIYTRPKWDNSGPVHERMQQTVDKGGICHIRAWIARSVARAFGIPARRVEDGGAQLPEEFQP